MSSIQQCKIYEKSFWDQNLVQRYQKQVQNQVFFAIFSGLVHQFSWLLHTMIGCNNVQNLVVVKSSKKKCGTQIWVKGAKIRCETRFFAIFSSLVYQFSLILHTVIACNNVQHPVVVKVMKNDFGSRSQIWPKGPKSGPKTRFFCYFLQFSSLVALEIA